MPYYPQKTNQIKRICSSVHYIYNDLHNVYTYNSVVWNAFLLFKAVWWACASVYLRWLCMTMNSGCHMFQFMHQWIFELVIVGRCVEMFKRFPQHNHQVIKGVQQLPRATGACVCVRKRKHNGHSTFSAQSQMRRGSTPPPPNQRLLLNIYGSLNHNMSVFPVPKSLAVTLSQKLKNHIN